MFKLKTFTFCVPLHVVSMSFLQNHSFATFRGPLWNYPIPMEGNRKQSVGSKQGRDLHTFHGHSGNSHSLKTCRRSLRKVVVSAVFTRQFSVDTTGFHKASVFPGAILVNSLPHGCNGAVSAFMWLPHCTWWCHFQRNLWNQWLTTNVASGLLLFVKMC